VHLTLFVRRLVRGSTSGVREHCYQKGLLQDIQTFSSEGHITCYTTVRGPDILPNVLGSGCYIHLNQQNFRKNTLVFFHYCQNGFAGRISPAGRSLESPGLRIYQIRGESKPERRSGKRTIAGTAFRLEFSVGW